MRNGYVFLGAIDFDATRCFWRQPEQRLDRGSGLRPRPQLQYLAQQGQRNNDCRCLVIHAHTPMHLECRGEKSRRDCGDKTVAVCSGDTGPNQGPHIRAAVLYRLDAAYKERPAGIQDNRRAEGQFDPVLARKSSLEQAVSEHRHQGDENGKG